MATNSTNSDVRFDDDAPKDARLELRSTLTQKTIIERAASLLGESVTSFVLSTVLRDAVKVINEHQVTELSLRDWSRFEVIVGDDAEPNTHLTESMKLYRRKVARSDGL
ncbi:MAG TPA: DUF1778 domain-containing protein [Rhodothermales bacterium]|nr:DUF1778 domain-containing protein [Rhodothermales bacterium]